MHRRHQDLEIDGKIGKAGEDREDSRLRPDRKDRLESSGRGDWDG